MYEYEHRTNCNDEVVIKLIGKLSSEFDYLEKDLSLQLKVKAIVEKVLYNYDVLTRETSLVSSDMSDRIKMYLAVRRLEGLSAKTLYNYKVQLQKLNGFFNKPTSTITTNDLRMYIALSSKDKRETSMSTFIYTLKGFFKWLVEEEYLLKNPMAKIKGPKIPKRLRKALTLEEMEKVKQACISSREKALIEFIYSTGCRVSEVTGVDKNSINWNELSVNVIGKGNKERKVYFNVKAKLLIIDYLKTRKDENKPLFVTSKRPYARLGQRSIEKEVSNVALRAGIEKSVFPHLLRHSFATHRLNSGMNITALQMLLGHTNPSTTQIYAALSENNIKHEYNKTS
jgi:integrase/recombinase XerD